MTKEQTEAQAKLERLGKRLRDGVTKARSVSEKELAAVRESLREQAIKAERDREREQERDRSR